MTPDTPAAAALLRALHARGWAYAGCGSVALGAEATGDAGLHAAVQAATGAACSVLAPLPKATALTFEQSVGRRAELLPALTPAFVLQIGHLPLLPYFTPGDPRGLERLRAVLADVAQPCHAAALERVGVLAWGADAAALLALLEVVEATARLWHDTFPRPHAMEPWAIDALRPGAGGPQNGGTAAD